MKREKARFVVSFNASPNAVRGDAYFRTDSGDWSSVMLPNDNKTGELSSCEMFDREDTTGWDSFVLVPTKKQHKKIQKMIDRQKAR